MIFCIYAEIKNEKDTYREKLHLRYVIEWEDFDGSGYCLKYCSRKKIDNRKWFYSEEGQLSEIMVFNSKEKAIRVKKRIEKQFCIILKIKKISNDTAKMMNKELRMN